MEAADASPKIRTNYSGGFNLKARKEWRSPEPHLSSGSCAGVGGSSGGVVIDQSDAARKLITSLTGTLETGCTVLEEVRRRLRPVAVRASTATAAASVGDFRGCLRHRKLGIGETSSSSSGVVSGLTDNLETVIRLTRQRLRPAKESRQPPKAEAAAAAATAAAAAADPEDEAALWGSPDFADLLRRRLRSLRPAQEAPPWMSQPAGAGSRLIPTAEKSRPSKLGDTDTDSQAGSELLDGGSFCSTPATATSDLLQHCEEACDADKGFDAQHCDRANMNAGICEDAAAAAVDVSTKINVEICSTAKNTADSSETAVATTVAERVSLLTLPVRWDPTGQQDDEGSPGYRPISAKSELEKSKDTEPQPHLQRLSIEPSLTSLPQLDEPPPSQSTEYVATVAAAHFERLGLASERQRMRRRRLRLQRLGPHSEQGLDEAGAAASERLSNSSQDD